MRAGVGLLHCRQQEQVVFLPAARKKSIEYKRQQLPWTILLEEFGLQDQYTTRRDDSVDLEELPQPADALSTTDPPNEERVPASGNVVEDIVPPPPSETLFEHNVPETTNRLHRNRRPSSWLSPYNLL